MRWCAGCRWSVACGVWFVGGGWGGFRGGCPVGGGRGGGVWGGVGRNCWARARWGAGGARLGVGRCPGIFGRGWGGRQVGGICGRVPGWGRAVPRIIGRGWAGGRWAELVGGCPVEGGRCPAGRGRVPRIFGRGWGSPHREAPCSPASVGLPPAPYRLPSRPVDGKADHSRSSNRPVDKETDSLPIEPAHLRLGRNWWAGARLRAGGARLGVGGCPGFLGAGVGGIVGRVPGWGWAVPAWAWAGAQGFWARLGRAGVGRNWWAGARGCVDRPGWVRRGG